MIAYYTSRSLTRTPTPTVTPTPSPPGQPLVLVAVGYSEQRVLDAAKRLVVAESLQVLDANVPAIEAGYRLKPNSDDVGEIIVSTSGDVVLTFTEISGVFTEYRSVDFDRAVKFFGRFCEEGADCAVALFQDLSGNFITLDEDVSAGRSGVPPWMRVSVAVPAGSLVRIEMVAYYKSVE